MPHHPAEFPRDLDVYRQRLRKTFGYADLRNGQAEALAALAETDVLGVMPTGSGKSLCYVLPALEVGRTLVVSPLIALMRDQVKNLERSNVDAAFINSSVSRNEKNARYLAFIEGRLPLLYIAPEGLRNAKLVRGLRDHGVNLLAIDEAHCISQWGHDFRPDYLTLGALREQLGAPRVLALTATADPRVRQDIAVRLGIDTSFHQVVTSFDRPNLDLSVKALDGVPDRVDWVTDFVKAHGDQSGIVYVRTRKRAEEVAQALQDAGVSAEAYHAGLDRGVRTSVQERFDDGPVSVIVATNAFGMGVDKPDVRYVVHFNLPGRLEAYYQEAGRAGRDGEPASCVLLYARHDRRSQQWFIDEAHPKDRQVREIWQEMLEGVAAEDSDGWLGDAMRTSDRTNNVLEALRTSGLVAPTELRVLSRDRSAPIETRAISAHRKDAESRLANMVRYAETRDCRRSLLLAYFGESGARDCGRCDNCRRSAPQLGRPTRHGKAVVRGQGVRAEDADSLTVLLRSWRLERARTDGIPAFRIFSNRTLDDIVRRRPRARGDLLRVSGLGEAKVAAYGEDLLKILSEHAFAAALQDARDVARKYAPKERAKASHQRKRAAGDAERKSRRT